MTNIGWLIIFCEIGFWIFVLAGLITRYVFKKNKLGAAFLLCTPIIDLILIVASIIDLKSGQQATIFHGIAAYYIGMTVAFGHQMIQWADQRFAYKFSNGPKPKGKPRYGIERARIERKGWIRHLLGWGIGNVLLFSIILIVDDKGRTQEIYNVIYIWLLVLVIDFIISFSYTIFPKKTNSTINK